MNAVPHVVPWGNCSHRFTWCLEMHGAGAGLWALRIGEGRILGKCCLFLLLNPRYFSCGSFSVHRQGRLDALTPSTATPSAQLCMTCSGPISEQTSRPNLAKRALRVPRCPSSCNDNSQAKRSHREGTPGWPPLRKLTCHLSSNSLSSSSEGGRNYHSLKRHYGRPLVSLISDNLSRCRIQAH